MYISGHLRIEESKIGIFRVHFNTPSSVKVDCENWVTLFRLFRLTCSLKPDQFSVARGFLKGKTAVVAVSDVERIEIEIDRAGSLGQVIKQLVKSILRIKSR